MASPPLFRWGFVFLSCPPFLAEGQREELVRLAVRAYMDEHHRIEFDEPMFSGFVRCISETMALGAFVGQRFEAQVRVPHGEGRVEFLVAEGQLRSSGEVAEA